MNIAKNNTERKISGSHEYTENVATAINKTEKTSKTARFNHYLGRISHNLGLSFVVHYK
jgi:hypothetical protein